MGRVRIMLAAGLATLWAAAASAQVASTTIQLPTVNTATVQTTVVVPDRGSVSMGGLKTASESRTSPNLGNASARTRGSTMFNTSATIHDIRGVEEMTAWEVAENLHQRGQVAAAIADWQKLATETADPELKQLIARKLEVVRAEGLVAFQAAVQQASTGESAAVLAASSQVDHLLTQYGVLIDRPELRLIQKQLANHPAVAESRHGGEADALLAKAREAEGRGKYELAKVYYRMAAKLTGTEGAMVAQRALEALPSAPPPATVPTPSTVPSAVVRAESTTPGTASTYAVLNPAQTQLLQLARTFRNSDPYRSQAYYGQLLQTLPATSPLHPSLAHESATVTLPIGSP